MSVLGAAAITAGASLAGGLLGSSSSSKEGHKNRKLAREQFNAQMDESIQRRVADGLKAGINPLAAIGASANVSPTIHAGGGSDSGQIISDSISRAGSAIGKAMLDKQADDMEFDTQAKQLDLEGKRLENRILRQRLNSMSNTPGTSDSETPPSMDGEELLFKPVYDLHGRPRLVINQNAIEADSDNPGYMSSIINAIGNAMINNQISPDGRVVSRQLQMMLDDFYYQTTGHHIKNLQDLYISPTEAAMAATMLARGVS